MHKILGQCAALVENRGFELNIIFISAVLVYDMGGAGGGVVDWGFQGGIGCVLHDWAGIGNRDGEQVCDLSVVPYNGPSWTVHS